MNSLLELIIKISKEQEVLGILEFGGRSLNDSNNNYSDYDIVVITEKLLKNVTGVHFYINDIPVDCMFLTYDSNLNDNTLKKKKLTFSDCRILYQKDNFFQDKDFLIKGANYKEKITSRVVSATRYSISHFLYKIEKRINKNELELEVGYYLSNLLTKCIQYYGILNELEIGKIHDYFLHIKNNNKRLYYMISDFFKENNNRKKFEIISDIAYTVLEKVGGVWDKKEIIYHSLSDVSDTEDVKWIDKLLFK